MTEYVSELGSHPSTSSISRFPPHWSTGGYYPWQLVVYNPFTILFQVYRGAKFANVEVGT